MQTQIPEPHTGCEDVFYQSGSGRGKEDLTAITDSSDSRGPVNFVAHQPCRRLRHLTGMDSHPHEGPCVVGPFGAREGPLHGDRGSHTSTGRREHGEEGVALGSLLDASEVVQACPD